MDLLRNLGKNVRVAVAGSGYFPGTVRIEYKQSHGQEQYVPIAQPYNLSPASSPPHQPHPHVPHQNEISLGVGTQIDNIFFFHPCQSQSERHANGR